MKKKQLKYSLMIISGMVFAILATFVLDCLIKNFGHENRFNIIFVMGGISLAIITVGFILADIINDNEN